MDFSAPVWWWVAAGLVVVAELVTGTVYLLMIALGMAAAAMAAHLGLSTPVQCLAAAAVGGGATALWHWRQSRTAGSQPPTAENRDVNLDVGEHVTVTAWASDRTAQVSYRGTTWKARLHPEAAAAAGEHRVQAVEGNWLVLAPPPRPTSH